MLWEEYFFLVEYGNLAIESIWKMDIATRRWWIDKLVDKYNKQNQAAESKNGATSPEKFQRMQEKMRQLNEGVAPE